MMKDVNNLTQNAFEWLDKIVKNSNANSSPYEEQKLMVRRVCDKITSKGNAIICQAPTGIGKTLSLTALAIALAQHGKRILISSPNYGHINTNILEHLKVAASEIKVSVLPGFSHRDMKMICPKAENSDRFASNSICRDWENSCQYIDCIMVRRLKEIKEAEIVNIVHSKLISDFKTFFGPKKSKYVGDFDVILIDECHNLPDVVEKQRVNRTSFRDWKKYYHKISDPSLRSELKELFQMREDFKDDLDVKKQIEYDISNCISQHKFQIGDDLKGTPLSSIGYKSNSIRTTSEYIYQIRELPPFNLKNKVSMGLFSATVSEPRNFLYKECLFDGINLVDELRLFGNDSPTVYERWKRLAVYGATDVADLKKEIVGYDSHRKKANQFLKKLLMEIINRSNVDFVTLILCRSKEDAENIKESFIENETIYNKMINVDDIEDDIRDTDSDSEEITDFLYQKVREEISLGKQFLLVSGSSLFWEAGTIDKLRLVIIDALPYRPPTERESFTKRRGMIGHFSSNPIFLFMLRRLQQGIGRLMRRDETDGFKEWGIALIIDQRFRNQWESYIGKKGRLPDILREKVKFFDGDDLLKRIPKTIEKLQNQNFKLKKDLFDYGKKNESS